MNKIFRTALASAVFCAAAAPAVSQAAGCVFPVVVKDYHTTVTADKSVNGSILLTMTQLGSGVSLNLNAAHTYVAQYSSTDKAAPLTFAVSGISEQFGSGGYFKAIENPNNPAADEAGKLGNFASLKANVERIAKCSLPAPAFQASK